MRTLCAALLFFALTTPLLAYDEVIRIEPARPTSTNPIRVTVSGANPLGCDPHFLGMEPGDGLLLLRFRDGSGGEIVCPPYVLEWSEVITVGSLRSGEWELRLMMGDRMAASTTFTVVESDNPVQLIPSSSRLEGGVPVRLRGAGIGECGSACQHLRVSFGGVDVDEVRVINGSELEVIAPPHAAGRVDVVVYYASTVVVIVPPVSFLYYDWAEGPPAETFETILVPLMFEGEGALGSRWTSELTVRNRGDAGIDPWNPLIRCSPGERCRPQIPPGATLGLTPSSLLSWMHGYLFAVPREQADDLDFSLHIRDLSRQVESFGTEIPVVREADLPRSPVVLLDVPLDPRFRKMLRIYDLAAVDGTPVVIRWRLDDGTQVGRDSRLILRTVGRCIAAPCWLPEPAGIALPVFAQTQPPGVTQKHLHLEIEPLAPHSRLWAFVTVTHNETQQVTTITPQ